MTAGCGVLFSFEFLKMFFSFSLFSDVSYFLPETAGRAGESIFTDTLPGRVHQRRAGHSN